MTNLREAYYCGRYEAEAWLRDQDEERPANPYATRTFRDVWSQGFGERCAEDGVDAGEKAELAA